MKARIALALALCLSIAASAQQGLDRKKIPPAGPTPVLRVPIWTKGTLANGADLIVSEKHDLPLISFSITFLGGDNQFEPAGRQGVASLTAALLSEGTKTRNADALSNALFVSGADGKALLSKFEEVSALSVLTEGPAQRILKWN